MPSIDVQVQIPELSMTLIKGPSQLQLRMLRWGGSVGVLRWSGCSTRVLTHRRPEGQSGKKATQRYSYWLWRWRKGPWAMGHRQLLEAGKGKETDSSWGKNVALTVAPWDTVWTSDLYNLCYLNPLSLW